MRLRPAFSFKKSVRRNVPGFNVILVMHLSRTLTKDWLHIRILRGIINATKILIHPRRSEARTGVLFGGWGSIAIALICTHGSPRDLPLSTPKRHHVHVDP